MMLLSESCLQYGSPTIIANHGQCRAFYYYEYTERGVYILLYLSYSSNFSGCCQGIVRSVFLEVLVEGSLPSHGESL